ncbi:MAG: hypothetical protein ACREAA_02490 [Candidatus Polarisedimenticolia bacterium]
MTAGGPGDHPLTDLLHWGAHPFPKEIEDLVLAIAAITPEALHDTKLPGADWWSWARGDDLETGVRLLQAKLDELTG